MRDKQVILEEIHQSKLKAPQWDTTASFHEQLTIEVLLDIRDILNLKLPQLTEELHNLAIKD